MNYIYKNIKLFLFRRWQINSTYLIKTFFFGDEIELLHTHSLITNIKKQRTDDLRTSSFSKSVKNEQKVSSKHTEPLNLKRVYVIRISQQFIMSIAITIVQSLLPSNGY